MNALSKGRTWILRAGAVACIFTFDAVLAAEPAAITPTGGDGQIAALGSAFPLPLSVRVTDADDSPVAGASVIFAVSECDGGDVCLEPGAYPSFQTSSSATVTTDDNGIAQSPTLFAGDEDGLYVVTAATDSSGDISAEFTVRQAQSMEAVPITSAFSGAWYDPTQSGHGILIEVLPNNRLLAYWFAFAVGGGQQAWFGGVGTIIGDQAIVSADQGQGGDWIPAFDPANYSLVHWGTLTFTFTDCNHGRVDYFGEGSWGSYHMDLTRLTQLEGLACP